MKVGCIIIGDANNRSDLEFNTYNTDLRFSFDAPVQFYSKVYNITDTERLACYFNGELQIL